MNYDTVHISIEQKANGAWGTVAKFRHGGHEGELVKIEKSDIEFTGLEAEAAARMMVANATGNYGKVRFYYGWEAAGIFCPEYSL